jgi:hypothetical protein
MNDLNNKQGIKTTEFWATMLGTILIAGAEEFGIALSSTSAIGIAGMIVTYIVGRVVHKRSINRNSK